MLIIGITLFVIAMVFYVRFVWRKSERDWEYIQETNRKHNEWMVDHGRLLEKQEQRRRDRRPTRAIDYPNWD